MKSYIKEILSVQLNKYETALNFIQISQKLTSDVVYATRGTRKQML